MMNPKDQPEKLKKVRFNWVPYENLQTGEARFILHNKVKCKYCGDIIESQYQHDFKQCKCNKSFVDGGHAYTRMGGDNIEILTEYYTLSKEEYENWKDLRKQFYEALKEYPKVNDDLPEDWVKSIKSHREYQLSVMECISNILSK